MNTPQQLAAESQIKAAMHRYASLARENADWNALSTLFAPDGIYRLPNGATVPPTRMSEVVQGNEAKYIRHHITTIDINFVSEEEARSEAFYLAVTELAAPDHWGCWRDVWKVLGDGRWVIQDRTIVVEGAKEDGWYARTYGVPDAASGTGPSK